MIKNMPPSIQLTKRGTLQGWKCTNIEVTISGFSEKWCNYEGEIVLTRSPNIKQKITILIILFLGWINRDNSYKEYVEKWVEKTNRDIETMI